MLAERLVYLLVIVVLGALLYIRSIVQDSRNCNEMIQISVCNTAMFNRHELRHIPKKIIQTWTSRDAVPPRMLEGLRRYGADYEYVFFDNDDAVQFLAQSFPPQILHAYAKTKNNAHKADLFRYCYLFLHGGIWLDVKTVLLRPVSEIFTSTTDIYTVRSIIQFNGSTCYQGILAVPPKTAFMQDMIVSFLSVYNYVDRIGYLTFCRQMHAYFEQEYEALAIGTNTGTNMPNLQLFEEYHKLRCDGAQDQYGLCTYVRDAEGRDLFKVRDAEYPHGAWKRHSFAAPTSAASAQAVTNV